MADFIITDDKKDMYYIETSFVLVFFLFFAIADYMVKSVAYKYAAPPGYALLNYAMPIVLTWAAMLLGKNKSSRYFLLAAFAVVIFLLIQAPAPINILGNYLNQFPLFTY
jgi:hypothetical protein